MRIRSFVLLVYLLFSSEYKASISFDSGSLYIYNGFMFLFSKRNQFEMMDTPFWFTIKIPTFYNFDLGIISTCSIFFGRRIDTLTKKDVNGGKKTSPFFCCLKGNYACVNEYTSFSPVFYFNISKRKEIKKFFERVDLSIQFSLPFLFFGVVFLTKDGASFKFFHLPECEKEEDKKKRGSPFYFSFDHIKAPYYYFLKLCNYEKNSIKKGSADIESVEKYFAFLYWLASCFTFWFDVRICSYLFCCIKISIKSVFEIFFIFRYLFLRKECDELSQKYIMGMNEGERDRLDLLHTKRKEKRDSMLSACTKKFPFMLLIQSLIFSIRIFDKEEIEE